ncbi:GNAT family N-acetyltransferase [Streptomyces sp. WI04-05B]|uniref:GNAT family N-acetyltransferase n=1 Tax=Streptomyces TaxID=1883 RepID=UPI0029A903D5|nr:MULTISPECIES: GNAT family N-acetyltransferase [unclassified Streptomyces]MDX2546498.1 GNAT family N-acetyltransferase [Streptomyces sp. WI04-05B]MDX2587870.1 GNAT family N-acetyltransferase [Streptomyces sp. WI04-05A]MDX3751532.1 GNAT family N-acetyltransferase [Streptomyces sp. AK08-02]
MTTTPSTGSAPGADAGATGGHPLDNPVHSSLAGPHAHLAQSRGRALRYDPEVCPFVALPDRPEARDWADVAALMGPGAVIAFAGTGAPPPDGWELLYQGPGAQLVDDGVDATPDEEAIRLTAADVPEMLALVERTDPGPFLPRGIELGEYLGFRHNGELIALAGERLRPPGWTEISAVCTDSAHRGRGLATRLVRAVAHGIRQRGDTPFLHAAAENTSAIRLYESLGFRSRPGIVFQAVRVPGGPAAG